MTGSWRLISFKQLHQPQAMCFGYIETFRYCTMCWLLLCKNIKSTCNFDQQIYDLTLLFHNTNFLLLLLFWSAVMWVKWQTLIQLIETSILHLPMRTEANQLGHLGFWGEKSWFPELCGVFFEHKEKRQRMEQFHFPLLFTGRLEMS